MDILIVEDNRDHCELMTGALAEHNPAWKITTAASGVDTQGFNLQDRKFDLIILDFSLPDKNGLEILYGIMETEDHPPVIMVTGHGDEKIAVSALKAGAYDYQIKTGDYLNRLPMAAQRAIEIHSLSQEMKLAETRLLANEEKYRDLVEQALDGICIIQDGKIKYSNSYLLGITGYPADEILEKPFADFIADDQLPIVMDNYTKRIKGEPTPQIYESVIKQKSGSFIDVEFNAGLSTFEDRPAVTAFVRDITERKKMNAQIEKSLRDKEILITELHHRVKNNLNLIISMLSLQARSIKNYDEAISAFENCRNRVYGMALVHEKLYDSGDISRIDMSSYISDMAGELVHTYSKDNRVHINIETSDLFLNINSAIPCGLILNEVLTNALKYAYPGGEKGSIQIKFETRKDGRFELVVQDNGIGIPAEIDFDNLNTLGFRLIMKLAEQLKGNIEIERENGTALHLIFPERREVSRYSLNI
jgi:PAS domain S-box-containing protein